MRQLKLYLSSFISTLCNVLLILSKNQQTPADAKGRRILLSVNKDTIIPVQNPKHKLHLNKLSSILNLRTNTRGILRIEPYLNIQCIPTQQINS